MMTKAYAEEHSKYFSPSSIARRISCHLSASLESQITEEGPKPAADYGTYGHHIAAEYLIKGSNPESFLDKTMFGQVCDQELIDCVYQYMADIDELKCRGLIKVETKVSLEWAGYSDVFGTADYISDEIFGTLTVLDLKTGTGVEVYPEDNAQLMLYALMCAGEGIASYEKIAIVVSQPRTSGRSLKLWETTPDYLLAWFKDTLEPAIQAIEAGDKTANPTEDNCMWCKACNICPAYAKHCLAVARVDFAEVAVVEPTINDDLVNEVFRHIPMLKSFVKKVEAHAAQMADVGTLQGYKLVQGRKSRYWKDEHEAECVISDNGFEPFETKILSPAKAEKLSKEMKELLQKYIDAKHGKPVITKQSDRRKALTTASDDFKNVAND